MKSKFLQIITIVLAAPLLAADENLPQEAAELLKKLEEWEVGERDSLEDKIAVKKSQVAALLETQLEQVTRSGNLDAALAIKVQIEKLRAESEETEDQKTEVVPEPMDTQLGQLSEIKSERDFQKWLEDIEFRNGGHISWIDGDRIRDNRGSNNNSVWGTGVEYDHEKKLISFTWTGASKAEFTIQVISNDEAEGILAGGNQAKLEIHLRSPDRKR